MTLAQRLSPAVVDLVGVRAARLFGFLKPCLPVRTVSDLTALGHDEVAKITGDLSIHVLDAAVCIEDHVFNASVRGDSRCPHCGTGVWMYLTDLRVYPVNPSDLWDEEKRLRRGSAPS